jgi:GWxTD domain-containing protein
MNKRVGLAMLVLGAGLALLPACGGGPRVALDPESKAFYQTARLIMTREESKIFNLLPDPASRKEFIDDFWAKRDPDPDNDVNEFKTEFQSRVDYAAKRFKGEGRPGWDTDRGRIYIFMGPPDRFQEDFTHGDPTVRGSIIWWIYYNYRLGIEFVDAKGTGEYKIRDYTGDFFEAMDVLKLGAYLGKSDAFLTKVVKFDLTYDRPSGEVEVALPDKSINFKENDEGNFFVDLRFKFYIYSGAELAKTVHEEERTFVAPNREIETMKDVPFRFALPLRPGLNYIDVIIQGKTASASGRIRKLFEVKVPS